MLAGLVTASGGAWNASIGAEYFHLHSRAVLIMGVSLRPGLRSRRKANGHPARDSSRLRERIMAQAHKRQAKEKVRKLGRVVLLLAHLNR